MLSKLSFTAKTLVITILISTAFQPNQSQTQNVNAFGNNIGANTELEKSIAATDEYTCGYLLGDKKKIKNFLAGIPSGIKQKALTLEFVPEGFEGSRPSRDRFPVKLSPNESLVNFPSSDYFRNLKTKELGQLVIQADVISSTMNVFQGKSLKHGLVVIANRQTQGRARGNKPWLSPEGMALFTVQVSVDLESELGRRIPMIQLLGAMAVVAAIPNHKEISLHVKWPNVICIERQKVGGVLVETEIEGNTANLAIGIGVNVARDNSSETSVDTNLNSALGDEDKLTPAILVAKVLSQLEVLLDDIQRGRLGKFRRLYKENRLQVGQGYDGTLIRVEVSERNYVEGRIEGIDKRGFLRVIDTHSRFVLSLNPDKYTLDIGKNLATLKL